MSNVGKYYNYLSEASNTMGTMGSREEDERTAYGPKGMYSQSSGQTTRSADGGDWDGGQHDDGHDEDDQEPDPTSGDVPTSVDGLWDYIDWWMDQLPQFEGAANTISRLMVRPSMSPQDWYDFFYNLLGFGGGPVGPGPGGDHGDGFGNDGGGGHGDGGGGFGSDG